MSFSEEHSADSNDLYASDRFYAALPVQQSLESAVRPDAGETVPDSWYVVTTDVRGSTKAIEAGRYREVNLLGAATITAVLNVTRGMEIPFAFGGDGAVLIIPPSVARSVARALGALKRIARQELGMELRAGMVPVSALTAAGSSVSISRFLRSPNSIQAVFGGGGTQAADRLLKDERYAPQYEIPLNNESLDLTGLECRWADVPSAHGETIALIVDATADTSEERNSIYEEIYREIELIYGNDTHSHPISTERLSLTYSIKKLRGEVRLRSRDSFLGRLAYQLRLLGIISLGKALISRGTKTSHTDWGRYTTDLTNNTDHRRFVDGYRYVLSGTEEQRAMLKATLERKFNEGKVIYGIHASDRAIVTCMVFDYSERHIHFVDSADGGFALAAKDLKQRRAAALHH